MNAVRIIEDLAGSTLADRINLFLVVLAFYLHAKLVRVFSLRRAPVRAKVVV